MVSPTHHPFHLPDLTWGGGDCDGWTGKATNLTRRKDILERQCRTVCKGGSRAPPDKLMGLG